jgi:hypothetical protein
MPIWLQYLIAFAALIIIAPFVARFGKRHGRRMKGGLVMASILFGFGEALDPPSKHLIEAQEGEEKAGPETGEPPTEPDQSPP